MDGYPLAILGAVARAAALQLLAAGMLALLLRGRWQDQPKLCRAACLLVLLQGWLLVPWTVAIPWYEPLPESAASAAKVRTSADRRRAKSPENAWLASAAWVSASADRLAAGDAGEVSARQFMLQEWAVVAGWAAAGLWFGGILALGISTAWRYGRFAARLCGLPQPREEWLAEWTGLLGQQRIRRPIRMLVTRREGPLLCRLPGGPAVLVPAGLWQELAPAARCLILRHELAHYQRGDLWKSLVARMLAWPQWFHPGAWWAVRMFEQCGERLCDQQAAGDPGERIDYARALAQLAAFRLPVHAVGSCAHSHPLVARVRFLLASPQKEIGMLHRAVLLAVAAALFLAGAVRVELIAKDATYTKESAQAKISELDQTLETLAGKVKELKDKASTLKGQVDARIAQAKEAYDSGRLSAETKRQLDVLQGGDESQQLALIAEAKSRGDEGLVLLGAAAGHSSYQAVRRKALQAAFELGVDAAPVFVYAFDTLPDADRIFLAEQLAKYLTPECVIGLGGMVERAGPEVQDAVIGLAAASPQRVLLFAVIGQSVKKEPATVAKLVAKALAFPGDDGLVALYALAKQGDAPQKIAAVKAAVQRKQEALPVLAAAYKCQEPEVRTAVVRAAKAIGGELAEMGIQMALQDPNAGLRQAAEKALQDEPAGK